MNDRHILCGSKPCGCVAVVLHLNRNAQSDQTKIAIVEQAIKDLGYKPEWLTDEEHQTRPWDCPEHRERWAVMARLVRRRVAHQEGLVLKG